MLMPSNTHFLLKLMLSSFVFLLQSTYTLAHPGIGIVKDSKGNIYYTDLQQVWKISNGHKSIAVPHVHTHELYIDAQDNLYGEHQFNNAAGDTFYHYMWQLQPNGKLDTVYPTQIAYQQINFSLARDKAGNEYYTRQFIKRPNDAHIYKKDRNGNETVFARGNFKGVTWLHPQNNGSLLFVQNNNVYKATPDGKVICLAKNIGSKQPSFHFSGNSITVWGVWQDAAANTYVAVFSDQAVKKIAPDGSVSNYYQSKGEWAPLHGVFDNEGRLWVIESSDKNEIRVVAANAVVPEKNQTFTIVYTSGILVTAILIYLLFTQPKKVAHKIQTA